MKMRIWNWVWCLGLAVGFHSCSEVMDEEVVSPDRHLIVGLTELDKEHYGDVSFAVYYNGERALPLVRLGMETNRQKYAGNLKFKSVSEAKPITDDYRMLTGKRSHCVNHGTERVYSFENEDGNILDVTVRAYDDGVAFKYGVKSVAPEEFVVDEHTAYDVPQGVKRWMQQYTLGYEGFYPLSTNGRLEGQPDANLWGYPGLVELRQCRPLPCASVRQAAAHGRDLGVALEGAYHRDVVGRRGVYVGNRCLRPFDGGGYIVDKTRFGFVDILGVQSRNERLSASERIF